MRERERERDSEHVREHKSESKSKKGDQMLQDVWFYPQSYSMHLPQTNDNTTDRSTGVEYRGVREADYYAELKY